MRMRGPAVAAVALVAALLAAAPAGAATRWRACPDLEGLRCATVRVPLDRSGRQPGGIGLRVARLEMGAARGRPLVYLSGGPGSAGVHEMLDVLMAVPDLAQDFDVYGYDQRGTGRSELLRCPRLERDPRLRSPRAGADCARRLGPRATLHTTADSVEDLEAVRRALGGRRLTLLGISYGTRLALAYARAHPEGVERLVLDSVVDPDDADPFGLESFRAMAPSLRALCPAGCAGVSSDPAADLAALVARLRSGPPMRAPVHDARGRATVRTLGPLALSDLLFDADYNPALRAAVPVAVRAALDNGDAAPLLRLIAAAEPLAALPPPRLFSAARYAAVCAETPLPWTPGAPPPQRAAEAQARAAALGAGAFAPFDYGVARADEIDLCLHWPGPARSPAGAGAPPPYPGVPTLILQGTEDLRTPPAVSARVAAAIPGAQRVLVPGVGHAVLTADPSGCALRRLLTFVEATPVMSACPRVRTGVPATGVPPVSLASVRPEPGLPPRVGRTVGALRATLADLRLLLSPAVLQEAGGGLRGGTWRLRGARLVLRRLRVVRGVAVSGRVGRRAAVLRVTGRRAARGRIRVAGGRLRGRLGGRRVSVSVRALPSAREAGRRGAFSATLPH
jgi:pimeloyl-ACP methyl ester carboxylesterase